MVPETFGENSGVGKGTVLLTPTSKISRKTQVTKLHEGCSSNYLEGGNHHFCFSKGLSSSIKETFCFLKWRWNVNVQYLLKVCFFFAWQFIN